MPSLRERKDDILLLARFLLKKYNAETGKAIRGISMPAQNLLLSHDWPGNIRQLSNTIERAVILEEEDRIGLSAMHIPEMGRTVAPLIQVTEPLEVHERELILKALTENLWVQKDAARCLGISPRALNYKIKKFGITHQNWRKHKKE